MKTKDFDKKFDEGQEDIIEDCSGLIQMDTSMRDNRPRLA